MKAYKTNYYVVVLYRLVMVLFLFLLCRLLFWGINRPMFPNLHGQDWANILKGGSRFDIAALFYFGGLPLLLMLLPIPGKWRYSSVYLKIVRLVFFIFIGIALLLNCIDFIYYRFTLRRTTFSVLKEFQNEKNGLKLATDFLVDFWYVVLIWAGLTLLMVWLYNRVQAAGQTSPSRLRYYITSVSVLLLTVVLAIGGIRGDFKHSTRPITISNAGEYVKSPNEIYLVLNTPFTFIRTIGVKGVERVAFYKEEILETIYTPVHRPDPANDFRKKNVVLIVLESFGKEAVGFYNKDLDNGSYKGYTPFLDSLAGQSKIFWNSFANGRKSIDAIPSCIASIPSGFNPFVLTPYVSDTVGGLAHALKNEGYHTSFFHGAPNGSMGLAAITKLLGVEHYYGKNEFGNDEEYDGVWGIWDEPFFQFFEKKLSSFQQPFFSTIFSVSSHHPFKVPKQYEGVFEKGPLPVFECISYTDMALRNFFDSAHKQPWFNNTLFIISADHATAVYHQEYQNAWGEYAIPILLYAPGDDNMKGISDEIIQQIDIMPTVLGYLNYDKPFLAYGNNVLDSTQKDHRFAYQYSGGYRWFQGDYLLMSDGQEPGSLYNWKTDRFLRNNLAQKKQDTVALIDRRLKAFIQQYNNRLIDNRLTVR